MLQNLIQNLELIFNEQKEYVIALKGKHDCEILKWKRTLEGDDAWDGQIMDAKVGNTSV